MKTNKTYSKMQKTLETENFKLQKRISELEGYVSWQEDLIGKYRKTIETLEGKLNGTGTTESGKNSKKSDSNEH